MSEMIIEDDVSPEDAQLAQELAKESIETTAETPSGDEVVDNQDDGSQEAQDESTNQEGESQVDPFTFKVKGEEKSYTKEQLQHLLSRDQTFQQKYESLRSSEEYKELIALKAAKDGDKGARKAILDQLKSMEEDLDALSESEETFDVDAKMKDSSFDEVFEDVKEDVDYQETIDKIETDLKSRMPEKVFKSYYDAPETRRTMYNLIKSGRTDEVFQGVEEAFSQMSLGERVKAKADPEFYGMMVVEVIEDLNARRDQTKGQTDTPESSGLEAVSTGSSSHRQVKADDGQVDWMNLYENDPAKFREMERKLLGRNY